MLKQFVTAASLTAAALSSSLAFAADDARSSIHITADIPTDSFRVLPRNPMSVLQFEDGRISHMTKVWNAGWSLRELGWID